jgi:hypothetical protein
MGAWRLAALGVLGITAQLSLANVAAQSALPISRTPDGRPDLQGFWTNGTITPLQRPPEFAGKEFLAPAEAAEFERTALANLLQGEPRYTYLDRLTLIDGGRTSIIVDPPHGRLPQRAPQFTPGSGRIGAISADDPEARTLDERCLLGAAVGSSSAAPPMIPNPFNGNFYQIVQTKDYIVILAELIHDARVIRLNVTRSPHAVRSWLGDSIGRWEGDSLVVETLSFNGRSQWRGTGERLRVVERFTRTDSSTMRYRASVEDPDRWGQPWTIELPLIASAQPVFEYACHEGNYSLGSILRGARLQ